MTDTETAPSVPSKDELIQLLTRDVGGWNEWRKSHPKIIRPDLSGADLTDAKLDGAYLRGVILRGATLRRASVRNADLTHVDFSAANCRLSDFSQSDLVGGDFSGATLTFANFSNADLRTTRGIMLDGCQIRGARFPSRVTDPWSALRRHYTGPRLLITLLLTVLYFLPLAARAAGWVLAAKVEASTIASLQRLEHALTTSNVVRSSPQLQNALAKIRLDLAQEATQRLEKRQVWQLILGTERGLLHAASAVALLVFNLGRLLMTLLVAPLRDEEERSGVSPSYHRAPVGGKWDLGRNRALTWLRSWPDAYGWMLKPHRVVATLQVVAIVTIVIELWKWLTATVYVVA